MGDDAPWQSLYVQISQLRAIVEDLRARQERQSRMAEILASAPEPQVPRPRRKRDRHGLHVVRGAAVLGAAGRWVVRSHAHRALAGGLIMATAAGASLTPDMMQHAPAAQLPATGHHHAAARRHDPAPVVSVPPAVTARRKRRWAGDDHAASAKASPSVSPSPTSPDPEPTVTPSPLPTPTVPPPPTPDPVPTCGHHGHGCHGGDAAGAAVRVLRGLRRLAG